jgi:hypothetical protein
LSTNIDWVAMLVSCSERLIHSDGTRRSTIFSLHDQGRQQHRQHQRRHHHLRQRRRQQPGLVDLRQQHEAELAARAQPQAGARRRALGLPSTRDAAPAIRT